VAALGCVVLFLASGSAAARMSANPCQEARLNTPSALTKETHILGAQTTASPDSEHSNACDAFSQASGREAEVYLWPKSQAATALQGILQGSFSGRTVTKKPLGGLGTGAMEYANVPTFTAGAYFVAIFGPTTPSATLVSFAHLVHSTLS